MKTALFAVLALFTAVFSWNWAASIKATAVGKAETRCRPALIDNFVGFVTNFFDTLGIGSFATTTALFRFWRLVRDEQLPGTLNVGHTLPSVVQAFIFISILPVNVTTLVPLISASVLGAWTGARVVSRWPRRKIQIGVGIALLTSAGAMLMSNLSLLPAGGEELGVTGLSLAVASAGCFLFGSLQMLGIGYYAPCMVMLSLLGMNPRAIFPIMMGSCGLMMPIGSLPFIQRGSYNLKSALGLAVGGVPAVLIVAFLVKSMPLRILRWLVIVVVCYTAAMMLRAALNKAQVDEVKLESQPEQVV
jgi:uncharacterized membrane protein YfcA